MENNLKILLVMISFLNDLLFVIITTLQIQIIDLLFIPVFSNKSPT